MPGTTPEEGGQDGVHDVRFATNSPGTRSRRRCRDQDIMPGWSTEVEPFLQESKLCYKRWMEEGKPRQGAVHEAKLRSHALFCHAVIRVKRSEKLRQAQGLFNAAMEGDICLFKEMKRVRTGGGEVEELVESVDGSSGEDEIALTFAKIFQTL